MAPKTKRVMFGLILAVTILTVAAAGLLTAGGMGIFDAFIHSMGTVSTGGFSNYNNGLPHFTADDSGAYSGLYIKYVIVFFMIIFGTSFTLFHSAIRSGIRVIKYDTEYNLYWIIILLASLLLFLSFNFSFEGTTAAEDISNGIFHAVSVLTTTGYTTDNPLAWPAFSQMVLLMLMFIGSCSFLPAAATRLCALSCCRSSFFQAENKAAYHGIQVCQAERQRDTERHGFGNNQSPVSVYCNGICGSFCSFAGECSFYGLLYHIRFTAW